jgi:integrase
VTRGNKIIYYDREVRGLGVRVTAAGDRKWILRFTINRRERTMVIGDVDAWTVEMARTEARRLRVEIDQGIDPLHQRQQARDAATVHALLDRWMGNDGSDGNKRPRRATSEEFRRLRPGTVESYLVCAKHYIRPKFGPRKAASLEPEEVVEWHRWVREHGFRGKGKPGGIHGNERDVPSTANHALAVLSRLCNLAIKWRLLATNPCKGVVFYPENKIERYLSDAETERLVTVLRDHANRRISRIVLLLLLTGARMREVMEMRWDQLDLDREPVIWTKLSHDVKQKRNHRIPLNADAATILREIKGETNSVYASGRRLLSDRQLRERAASLSAGDTYHYRVAGKRGAYHQNHQPIERLCASCKRPFMAYHKDAMYCDGACLQWAHNHPEAPERKVVPMVSDFVFPGDIPGKPIQSIRTTWEQILRAAKIEKFRIHDLRHSFASLLLNRDVALPVVGELLGHRRVQTTMRYAHLLTDTKVAALEKLGTVVSLDKIKKQG